MGSSVDDAGVMIVRALEQFAKDRFTGQVQFHVHMVQGGVSQSKMITQSVFFMQSKEHDLATKKE